MKSINMVIIVYTPIFANRLKWLKIKAPSIGKLKIKVNFEIKKDIKKRKISHGEKFKIYQNCSELPDHQGKKESRWFYVKAV